MKINELYKIYKRCGGRVTTDSRTLTGGELFFALRGENFDGNEYALKALESGAAFAVVDADSSVAALATEGGEQVSSLNLYSEDGICRIIPVENTLKTLQELARWHRSMTLVDGKPLRVIALTGTNGKTTTKELIRQVLSVKYNVTATEGNLNNNIGVPLTLLRINDKTQIAVVEMGASHPGDIKELVDIALPNFGLITNVGKAHLLGFGSFEGVMKTKGELYDYLRRTADKVFINADNPYLCKMASERTLQSDPERPYSLLIPYGVEYQHARILPSSEEHPFLRIVIPMEDGREVSVNTELVGTYNADNVMAAIAVGGHFGVSLEDAAKAVDAYHPSNNRSQMTKTERNLLIVDAYNANPTSMAAALDNFSSVRADNKAALLGDMLELGTESVEEHIGVIRKVLGIGLDEVFFVGTEFGKALEKVSDGTVEVSYGERMTQWKHFDTSDALKEHLENNPLKDYVILVKGSRGTRMEKTIPTL
ncbi:MAG: UDP-N-acetylmuramoyl-tripeptide--D-alanyl-D-alanine ligase [Candidatus Cryptobacteroides sp.]